jgi:tetratricopeptide (TPR) repeat protein
VRYRRRNFPAPFFWFLFLGHRFPEAIQEARIAVSLDPNGPGALWFLGDALIANGQPEEAIAPMEKALANRIEVPECWACWSGLTLIQDAAPMHFASSMN